MHIKGLVWLGTRTRQFDAMVAMYRDQFRLSPTLLEPGFAVFDLPNGDRVEVFGADSPYNEFITSPVAGFLVDDINAARAELEQAGIQFIGPIHEYEDGNAWTHYTGPDGFIYELTTRPDHPLQKT